MTSDYFFENISQQFNEELPFVVYRKPNETVVKTILQEDAELHITKDYSESGFVFSPFDAEENSILIPIENSETISTDFIMSSIIETSHKEASISKNDKQQHINLVKNGIKAIKDENLKKVVLSRCETVTFSENNPLGIFKRLLNTYTTAFVYCWYHPKVGLWLGATPETLLKIQGNRFETMSLAGTQAYKDSLEVEWQVKEKEEQQIVTDSVVESLHPFVTDLQIAEVETIKAGTLLHLRTKISGTLNFKALNFKQVLQALHPTPAICGFPKDEAKHFILKSENYHRAFYTGFLGELNMKQSRSRNTNRRNVENNAYASVKTVSNLFVNLRCMQLIQQQALIYIGGGITKESVPEKEWEETQKKTQTMKSVL